VSVPCLVVAGVESSPALDLAAGALVAALGRRRATRPIMVGLETGLWRLLYESPGKAPRVLDPALHTQAVAAELFDFWTETVEAAVVVAARPVLDRWEGVEGSRPADYAARFDAPVVLVLDARERGGTAAAAVVGVRALARGVEIGGLIIVGADDGAAGNDLADVLKRDAGLPVLGRVPPQLSEQFARQMAVLSGAVKTIGPKPPPNAAARLCEEAAGYLQVDQIEAIAGRRGFVPAVQRRLFAREHGISDYGGLAVAVAWGPPLQPLALENIDVLQAAGLELRPLNISRDRCLPPGISGLVLGGQVDEDQLVAFTANTELLSEMARAIDSGLPTIAYGGGALLLLRRLSDSRGRSHQLVGAVPAEAELIEWHERPRYVRVSATRKNPYDEGDNVLYELFDLEYLVLEQESFAYSVRTADGAAQAEGFAVHRCLATALYPSLALSPGLADRFVDTMGAAGKWE
jgi:cobyrinic acid a,c-diamide synthase